MLYLRYSIKLSELKHFEIHMSIFFLHRFYFRTCLKYIEQTIQHKNNDIQPRPNSIVEKILKTTNNPKLAAVLALDLFLVGIDTVYYINYCGTKVKFQFF